MHYVNKSLCTVLKNWGNKCLNVSILQCSSVAVLQYFVLQCSSVAVLQQPILQCNCVSVSCITVQLCCSVAVSCITVQQCCSTLNYSAAVWQYPILHCSSAVVLQYPILHCSVRWCRAVHRVVNYHAYILCHYRAARCNTEMLQYTAAVQMQPVLKLHHIPNNLMLLKR